MGQPRKIRQIKSRLHTTNRARRNIIRTLCNDPYDQIVFAARRADTGKWVTCSEVQHDVVFYACELIKAQTQAGILAEHLTRVEKEHDS